MNTRLFTLAFVSIITLAGTATAEDLIAISVPAPVKESITREIGEGKITELRREEDNGQSVYEIIFNLGSLSYKASFAPNGKLRWMELKEKDQQPFKIDSAPAELKGPLIKLAKPETIEEIVFHRAKYEFIGISNGQKCRFEVDQTGRLLRKEAIND